ncbi:glutaminyl-peptide cyclotransferase [Mangrovibacterium sp.]|uniref:glutaminyl-peptide cyclotransferase n=1 Tax=Mangrovibacterium sp. TaxID=1961364 RepID=UPI0035625A1F
MRFKVIALVVIGLFLLTGISCSNTPKKSRKPVAQITLQPKKKKLALGDSVRIEVTVKVKDGELDKAELFYDNQLLKTSEEEIFNFTISKLNALGKHQIKVVSTKQDGEEGVSFQTFEVLSNQEPELYSYEIVNTYPHDTNHFTQGLEVHENQFYESTGQNGESSIYRFDLQSGKVLQEVPLDKQYFGEGITIVNNKIFQLTYKAQKCFVYDLNSFARIDSFSYNTAEGWGLTHDGEYLIKTDGSEFLDFVNPETFQVVKRIPVYDDKGPVTNLNELEYYEGYVYANIWQTNFAVKIDPKTGQIAAKIDFSGLMSVMYNPSKPIDVLNGIAFNKTNGKMYVTGKLWPNLFEVKLTKKD